MNQTNKIPKLSFPDFGFPVHALLVEHKGALLQNEAFAPYQDGQLHRMFSITKSFCSLAIGALCAEGKLSLDDKIVDFFPEYVKTSPHPYLADMSIRNMLMMQTCYSATTYKLDMTSDWVESFFTTEPSHRAGQIFNYDTSASHTFAALIKKLSGKGVLDYLRTLGFDRLGLSADAYIICDPFGAEMGGSGLMARPSDLLIAMRLVMDLVNGTFFDSLERTLEADALSNADGSTTDAQTKAPQAADADATKTAGALPSADTQRALYPSLVTDAHPISFWLHYASYLKAATSWQTPNIHTGQTIDEQQGYGYQFWMLRDGGCAMYGMGGQYAIMYPQLDLIYVTAADTQNIKGGTQFLLNAINAHMRQIYAIEHAGVALDAKQAATPKKATQVFGMELDAQTAKEAEAALLTQQPASETALPFAGSYRLHDNASGFTGFDISDGLLRLSQRWGAIEYLYEFPFGWNETKEGRTDKYQQRIFTSGRLEADGAFYLNTQILDEYVGSIHMLFRFTEGKVSLFMRKIEETYFKEFGGFFEGERC